MFSLLTLNLLITSPQLKSLCYKPEGRGFDISQHHSDKFRHPVVQLVEALSYKPEGRGFDISQHHSDKFRVPGGAAG